MKEVKLTGGARIGRANATFPFATLRVTKNRLDINASLLGSFSFQPGDIESIEPYSMIPVLGQGIKINHKVSTYKERIIFWTFKNPKAVLQEIRATGFLNNENRSESSLSTRTLTERQAQGGFPFKKWFAIGLIVLWNLLFMVDLIPLFLGETDKAMIGNGILTAVGIVFLSALLTLISADFRSLVLKEGRELDDVRTIVIFVVIVSGIMLLQLNYIASYFA